MMHPKKQSLPAFIGFGEAGQAFAVSPDWRAYDLKDKSTEFAEAGVTSCHDLADAVVGARALISVVTADQAAIVAQNAAQHIATGALYFDMNSVAPDTKRAAAAVIEAAGGRYVETGCAIVDQRTPCRCGRCDVGRARLHQCWCGRR
jgi:3-hydroxyisobutyrate dehydrogenase-like beta-hydroxyacid dehydrogenase